MTVFGLFKRKDRLDKHIYDSMREVLFDSISFNFPFLNGLSKENNKEFFKSILLCISNRPKGAGKFGNVELKNYQLEQFCKYIIEDLKRNHNDMYRGICDKSALYQQFGKLWPECDKELNLAVKPGVYMQMLAVMVNNRNLMDPLWQIFSEYQELVAESTQAYIALKRSLEGTNVIMPEACMIMGSTDEDRKVIVDGEEVIAPRHGKSIQFPKIPGLSFYLAGENTWAMSEIEVFFKISTNSLNNQATLAVLSMNENYICKTMPVPAMTRRKIVYADGNPPPVQDTLTFRGNVGEDITNIRCMAQLGNLTSVEQPKPPVIKDSDGVEVSRTAFAALTDGDISGKFIHHEAFSKDVDDSHYKLKQLQTELTADFKESFYA